MPLNMRLVSAGKITDSLGREWDPIEHPRGRDGRFIRVFKLIHMFLNSQDSEPWGTAQVTQINPNGSVRAKVTAVADPKWNDRIGHEVDLLPGSIESLNEKASLAKAKEAVGNVTAAIDKYDFSPEKMHDFYVASGFDADSPTGDMALDVKALADFKQHGIKLHGRTKYHLALYAKSISGGGQGEGPTHTDDDFMDLLEEFDVDPKVIDDTPDGMSGLKVLADGVNVTRSPNYKDLDNIAHFDEMPPLAPGTIREARLRHSDVYVRWYADGKQSVVLPDGTEKQHDKNKGSLLLAAHEANQSDGVSPDANVPASTDVLEPPELDVPDNAPEPESQKKFEVLDDPGKNGDGYYNAPGSKLWGKYGAAGVMIRHTDENGVERFLMVQRGPIVSSNKGKWQLPGGALNSNENDYQGTARELVEELSPPDGYLGGLTPVGEVKLDHPSGWHYNNITADSPEQFEPKVDGTETGDAGWFTKEEIANLPLHPALADNLDNIFNTFNSEIDVPDTSAPPADDSFEWDAPNPSAPTPDDQFEWDAPNPNAEPKPLDQTQGGTTSKYVTKIADADVAGDSDVGNSMYDMYNEKAHETAVAEGLSKLEYLGLVKYVNSPSVNDKLRKAGEGELDDDEEVLGLDSAISRHRVNKGTTLYRGLAVPQAWGKWADTLQPGATVNDKGYMSTSHSEQIALEFAGTHPGYDKVIFEYEIDEEVPGFDISASAVSFGEDEILLPRNTTLLITDRNVDEFGRIRLKVKVQSYHGQEHSNPGADGGAEEGSAPEADGLDAGSDHSYAPGEHIDATQWEQVGGQGGSNTGGLFKDEQGNQWYVKNQKSETHAKNEALAAALYEEAGISSAPQILADTKWGPNGTASPWIENTKDFSSKRNDPEYRKKVQEGFAFDAWIANWDTMGLVWDNIVTDKDGNPLRVDPGGALYFRAQGKPKGAFGDEVNELFTFKDQSNNAGKVFHDIDEATELASAQKVIDISPEKIDELVDAMNFPSDGPFDGEFMKKTLKARRVFIADHYGIPLPENEATPDPVPEDITDADLPDGFTPIESNGPAIDYIDKHSIYFFNEDTQDDIAGLGGYHAENAYGKLAAYFADVQNGDSEFNSEVVDKYLDDMIASLEVDFDYKSEINAAKHHVKKLVAMRDDLIPFENKPEPDAPSTPEPDTSLNLPGPESTDWQNMVDDQGPYRWGFGGQKLRVGDQVISKNDGITGVIHSFEKNHKGIVVKTPDGKKKARKNDSLALVSDNATPEPTPAAHTPEITTHDENGESSIETQLLAWWDKAADGDKFAFNSSDGLTYYFELDAKNDQMHFKDPGGDTIESWYANPDKGIDMDKLVDSAYLLQHPPVDKKPRVSNSDDTTYDELAQSIQTNTEELAYFNDTYSNDYGGYVGNIVAETRHDFENGKISAQAAADIMGTLYHEFAQKNENGDDNGLPDSAVEALYELANDYYEIDKVSPVDGTSPKEVYTGIAPLFDDNLGEFLGKYGKYSPEQNGKSLQDLLNEDISELEDGSLSQSDFMDGLHTYADQLQESGQTKLANELMSVIKSAPEPDDSNDKNEGIRGVDQSLYDELQSYTEIYGHSVQTELDVYLVDEIDNLIEQAHTGDITPEELGQKLEALASQIDEPWNPAPGDELHKLAAKFPQPVDNNDLNTALDNFIADIPSGDIFDKQEYNLPGGYTLSISEPDEDGDGHITLQDSNGDNLESWTYAWSAYSPDLLKTEIQDVIQQEEDDKKPKDPNAPDPWNSSPTNSADPNGHSKASAVIEHLIDDWQTGDIFDGKNVNLPYGLSFRFTDNDSDPVNYAGPKFQVVDSGNGEVIDEWPAVYAEKNVEGMRTYVEAILDTYKNNNDTKPASKGMFSPPDDMDGVLGDGDLMEWMIGEHNEKLDNVLTQIQDDTGAEFEADAGDIYDVLTGNQDPNKYPQYAIAAIAAADHLYYAGALDQGDMETLYDALGIPGSFYTGKKPHEIIQAIKSGKGFGDGDDKNVGTIGDLPEVDNELAEWEKEILWNAPKQVDGAHQPDSMDAAKAFFHGNNPPVGVQLTFTGYNWTLSYELDGNDKPVYVLRDQDSAIHAAWDPSDVTPATIDGIVSDIWMKMHANDVYEDDSATDLPYSTLENDDPMSNGFIAPNATPNQVNDAVDQFVKNVHGKIVFSGDYLSLPDGYKLKFILDNGTPMYQLFDGDDSFINEWDFDQDDLVSDISLSLQEEIPSLGLSSGKKTPVGNPKIDYNGNTYDTPPPGFKVHAVSTTSQDVVLVEHPNGELFQYYIGGGHDYVGPNTSLPNFLQNTNAWKPAPGTENNTPSVGKLEDINGFISEIPHTIYGVKKLFPNMTDYQAKQYRNAHYALTDAKYDTPLSADWQKHVDKAKYNLEQAGPDALPMLEKLKKWETDVKGTTPAPEPDPNSIDLGPGYAKLPPGHTPKFIWNGGGANDAVAVEGPDGKVSYYYDNGMVVPNVVGHITELDGNPDWTPYGASSAPSDKIDLGPKYAKPPVGSKGLGTYKYKYTDEYVHAIEHPNGTIHYYYGDGTVLASQSTWQEIENDPSWGPFIGGETDLGPGFQKVPAGFTPKYIWSDGTAVAVQKPDGSWTYFFNDGSTHEVPTVTETDIVNNPSWAPYAPAPSAPSTPDVNAPNAEDDSSVPGDVSVAVGSQVSKYYGHDYVKQEDGTWKSPTNPKVVAVGSPAEQELNELVKNPGTPVPKGSPGTNKPHRVDGKGNAMFIGDTVKSTNDGIEGTIIKFENNDKGVVVWVPSLGKQKIRARKTLVSTMPNAAPPEKQELMPSHEITTTPSQAMPPFGKMPAMQTHEPDPNSPFYGVDKPEPPASPIAATLNFVDDAWMAAADANYKKRMAAKGKPLKDLSNSSTYQQYINVQKNGDLNELDNLLAQTRITQEMYDDAKAQILANAAKIQAVQDAHDAKVQQWRNDLKAWYQANGLPTLQLKGLDHALKMDNATAKAWFDKNQPAGALNSTGKLSSSARSGVAAQKSSNQSHFLRDIAKVNSFDPDWLKNNTDHSTLNVIKNLDKAMEESPPIVQDVIVTRTFDVHGMVDPVTRKPLKTGYDLTKLVGSVQQDFGFAETSVGAYDAGATAGYASGRPIRMQLMLPKGTRGVYTMTSGQDFGYHSERGFILERGLFYYIHSVEYKNGHWYMNAEVIPKDVGYENFDNFQTINPFEMGAAPTGDASAGGSAAGPAAAAP